MHLVEKDLPEPPAGHVRVTVEASGVCHTDSMFIDGQFPGASFPLVAGHEIAGRIDAVGDEVAEFAPGDRVSVGWFGGNCGHCDACREGDAINCATLQVPGLSYPGGFADAVIVPATALAHIPDSFSAAEAAPMGCAGVTVFNALRRSAARPGDLVAILGIGGLTHRGEVIAVGLAPEPFQITPSQLIDGEHRIYGHASGTSREVEETLHFAALSGVRPMIEEVPLADAAQAMDKMLAGQAHFRMVLTTGN